MENAADLKPLKPCPFCGGEADYDTEPMPPDIFSVWCKECRAGFDHASRDGDLVEAWNRRAGEAALVEALERAESFIIYLLTHAPEEADENNVVQEIRAAINAANTRPEDRLSRMREALLPFARQAEDFDDGFGRPDYETFPDATKIDDLGVHDITVGHCRRARAALEEGSRQ